MGKANEAPRTSEAKKESAPVVVVDDHEQSLLRHFAWCGLDQETLGVAIWTTSTIWTTLMGVVVQVADNNGASAVGCLMARSILSIALVLLACVVLGVNPLGTHRQFLTVQGFCSVGGIIGRVLCYQRLPIAIVNLFTGLMPMFTAWMAVVFLGEYMGWTMIFCYIPSVVGMLLVLQPWYGWGGLDRIGLLELLAFQISSSLSSFLIRLKTMGKQQEHQLAYNFYAFSISTACSAGYCAVFNDVKWIYTEDYGRLWPWFLLIAITGLLTQLAVTTGISLATVTRCTNMRYMAIPAGAFADVIFFGNFLSFWQYVGILLVMASAITVMFVREEEEVQCALLKKSASAESPGAEVPKYGTTSEAPVPEEEEEEEDVALLTRRAHTPRPADPSTLPKSDPITYGSDSSNRV